MATITGIGIGSGLDVNSILEQIVEAERTPTENRLNVKEAKIQAEISALGTLKGAADVFQSSLAPLRDANTFLQREVTSSDESILTGSATSIAESGNYSLEVFSLAESHALASVGFDSLQAIVGTGELTFTFGTTDYDPGTSFADGDDTYTSFTADSDLGSETITIDSTNNTLEGIRDAVNNADFGITASIIDDGTGFRLLFTSELGASNSVNISVNEGGAAGENIDTTGLSQLAFNADATNLEQTQAASDAVVSVNGLTLTRTTNEIVGAINGVTIDLLKAEPGTKVQVSITENEEAAIENINNFVASYNELLANYKGFTSFNADTGQGGILQGDATARNFISQIRREVTAVSDNGSQYNSLSSIGISTTRDGSLEIDSDTLQAAIDDDVAAVARLFHPGVSSSTSNVEVVSSSLLTRDGKYSVNVSSLASQGQLTSNSITLPLTLDSNNNTLSVLLDGASSGELTLPEGTYTELSELADIVQTAINSVSSFQAASLSVAVSVVGDRLELTSSTYGSLSSVAIETDNLDLGLTESIVGTPGNDVVGTIGGVPATGEGQQLTGDALATGLVVEISGQTTGSLGFVSVSNGLSGRLDTLLDQFLSLNGQFEAKTDTLNSQIDDINEQRVELEERVAVTEARFRAQFEALDVLLSQLQTTSDFLGQQLDTLPGFVTSED